MDGVNWAQVEPPGRPRNPHGVWSGAAGGMELVQLLVRKGEIRDAGQKRRGTGLSRVARNIFLRDVRLCTYHALTKNRTLFFASTTLTSSGQRRRTTTRLHALESTPILPNFCMDIYRLPS